MRYSINDYRFRSDGLVGNVHSNSSVVGGGISGVTGTGIGGMASSSSSIISDVPHSPTPPLQRRLAKSFSVAPSSTQNKGALSFCTIIYTHLQKHSLGYAVSVKDYCPNEIFIQNCSLFSISSNHTLFLQNIFLWQIMPQLYKNLKHSQHNSTSH